MGAVILLLGSAGAVLLYRTAGDDFGGAIGYEEANGTVYPIMPEDSKIYLRNLELINGKAGVLMYEFNQWFVGLWHGKSLAFTVAYLTLFISIGIFFVAYRL